MAVDPTPKFEHAILEQDIAPLAAEIREHKSQPSESGRDVVRAKLHEYLRPGVPMPAPSASTQKNTGNQMLPNYLADSPAEIKFQVEKLIDLAWHKGVMTAVKEARKKEPLVLDAFHDVLTDRLYEELKKRGHVS